LEIALGVVFAVGTPVLPRTEAVLAVNEFLLPPTSDAFPISLSNASCLFVSTPSTPDLDSSSLPEAKISWLPEVSTKPRGIIDRLLVVLSLTDPAIETDRDCASSSVVAVVLVLGSLLLPNLTERLAASDAGLSALTVLAMAILAGGNMFIWLARLLNRFPLATSFLVVSVPVLVPVDMGMRATGVLDLFET
jgi:hypothetical protein